MGKWELVQGVRIPGSVMRPGHEVLRLLDIQLLLGVTEEQKMELEVGCI